MMTLTRRGALRPAPSSTRIRSAELLLFSPEPDPWPNCHVVTFESLHPNVLCSTDAALVRPDDAEVLFFGSLGDEG
jgi:hypothetical protein